jgi:hypothetical protein
MEMLGVPPGTARVAWFFARNPTARPTVRELQRTLGVASASAQRDLGRLARGGALRVVVDGRMRRYAARIDHPFWEAVRHLIDPPAAPGRRQVRERASKYGVDLGQLESMLLLSVEERLRQLDANASFIAEARRGLRAGHRT